MEYGSAPASADNSIVQWDRSYSRRRPNTVYISEDRLLFPTPVDQQTTIDVFLSTRRSVLGPSEEHRFPALRSYMSKADADAIFMQRQLPAALPEDIVLVDDRRDPTGGATSMRVWDSEGENGYLNCPPVGENIRAMALNIPDFVARLREKRQDNGAEKRTIFIANMSPEATLALASTVTIRLIPALRDFLNLHLLYRVFFSVTLSLGFELQFHMPFLSLRRRSSQNPQDDKRKLGRRSLRAFRKLPLARDKAEEEYYYYEAHTSFLVTGVDEWFWTLYCCVDTYFGSEPEYRTYLDGQYGSDPATGGFLWLKFPRWNPREYFLVVLSRRMMQATREWRALIDAFEERMEEYEERTLFDFRDDLRLSRTKELTLAVSTLRRFRDSLSRTVDAWSIFEQRDIQTFHVTINDAFRQRCEGHLANVRGNISELQSLQTLISQKLELFNSMRDGLVNASALRESAAATRQGEYIGLLTRMTVFYLPLSLSTALFSISMVPSSNITWVYYIIVCLTTTAITLYVAAYPKLLGIFFHTGDDIMAKERKIPGST